MESKKITLLAANGETVQLEDILGSIVRKISEKDVLDNSQGKLFISAYIEKLIEKDDPFVTAIATLGGEQTLNAFGILLFVAFQMGYTMKAQGYSIRQEE
jgi:hypothetical protein